MSAQESTAEHEELVRLRAEVAALRAARAGVQKASRGSGAGRARSAGAALLLILGCVLVPLGVVATWLDTQVTDTDRYVETVSPLIEDPALQQALARVVTAEVFQALDVEGVTQEALGALTDRTDLAPGIEERITGLATPMTDGVQTFLTGQVQDVVASDRFATVWSEANRVVHAQLVATLTGQTREGVEITDGSVSLDIAPFVEAVQDRLVDRGIGVAERIPEVHTSFLLFEIPNLTQAQTAFATLDTLGTALPLIALAVLAGGVLLAHSRRRALIGAGLGVAASMLALGVALLIARGVYLSTVPPELLPREPAGTAFDTLVRFLRTSMRSVFLVGLIVAVAAYLSGRSEAATAVRRALRSGFDRLRHAAGRPGGLAGARVGGVLATYRRVLRVLVVAAGAFVLLVMDRPSPAAIIGITAGVLLVLVVLEVLSAPAESITASEPPAAPAPAPARSAEPVTGPAPPAEPAPAPATSAAPGPSPQARPAPGSAAPSSPGAPAPPGGDRSTPEGAVAVAPPPGTHPGRGR